MMNSRLKLPTIFAVCALLLAGCGGSDDTVYADDDYWEFGKNPYDNSVEGQSVFGPGGLSILGGNSEEQGGGGGPGIGVNVFLWRASLDTMSFLPLSSADPFGGVIISEWYSPPESPDERFKVNIFILDRDLRADGVRATVFRQTRSGDLWIDAPVDERTGLELENSILTRARQLRIAGLE